MAKRKHLSQDALLADALYWRVALQRKDDADALLSVGHNTGAIYLAGYAVECALKALILSRTPRTQKQAALGSFRGRIGHDLESLKELLVRERGEFFPRNVVPHFVSVNRWSTDLRYHAGATRLSEATSFLKSAEEILAFVKMRLGHA